MIVTEAKEQIAANMIQKMSWFMHKGAPTDHA